MTSWGFDLSILLHFPRWRFQQDLNKIQADTSERNRVPGGFCFFCSLSAGLAQKLMEIPAIFIWSNFNSGFKQGKYLLRILCYPKLEDALNARGRKRGGIMRTENE